MILSQQEKRNWEEARAEHPELFLREPMLDSPELLKSVGIASLSANLSVGWIKLFPEDFVVEEVSSGGALRTVELGPLFGNEQSSPGGLYAGDLVKYGYSTFEARDALAAFLNTAPENVRYAGIKDKAALTSQRVTMRGVKDPRVFEAFSHENFFLKNIRPFEERTRVGELEGNRFSVLVRFAEPLAQEGQEKLRRSVQGVEESGFWNFFWLQRFWGPRFVGHEVGKLLIQGKYQEASRLVLISHDSARELPYMRRLREKAEELWMDWERMKAVYEPFPSVFYVELKMLEHLLKNPEDFVGAFRKIPDSTRLFLYGYAAYLFNKKVSGLVQKGEARWTLPQITSSRPAARTLYAEYLAQDGVVLGWGAVQKSFPFFRLNTLEWPVLQEVEVHGIETAERFCALSFTLKKGAYATTFLAHLFELGSELPPVSGVSTQDVDVKEVLGQGNLAPALERFASVRPDISHIRGTAGD